MKIETVSIASLVLDPANARFFNRITKTASGCWDFKDIQGHTGYGIFGSKKITWRAHRWIMWSLGKIERHDKRCVLHTCDNRKCVNPEHLYLGDRFDNAQDIKKRGRTHLIRDPKLGSKNPSAKLTEQDVLNIRTALAKGVMGKDLCRQYLISPGVMSEIKTRKLWAHI